MKGFAKWLFVLAIITLAAVPASADECEGVFFPNQITIGGAPVVLNGLGVREATVFNVNVYVAALYVPTRTRDASTIINADDQPRRLSLRFVRDVDRGDITDAWTEGFANNTSDVSDLRDRINQLNGWMEDIEDGERLTFTYVPGEGVYVEVKGEDKGVIPGSDFARAFFAIWLGDDPPNSGLKRGLLGGRCG